MGKGLHVSLKINGTEVTNTEYTCIINQFPDKYGCSLVFNEVRKDVVRLFKGDDIAEVEGYFFKVDAMDRMYNKISCVGRLDWQLREKKDFVCGRSDFAKTFERVYGVEVISAVSLPIDYRLYQWTGLEVLRLVSQDNKKEWVLRKNGVCFDGDGKSNKAITDSEFQYPIVTSYIDYSGKKTLKVGKKNVVKFHDKTNIKNVDIKDFHEDKKVFGVRHTFSKGNICRREVYVA